MGAFLGALLTWFLGLFFKGPRQPSAEAVAAAKAATAETVVKVERTGDVQLAKGQAAVETVERSTNVGGDKLRHDIATDPDNLAS